MTKKPFVFWRYAHFPYVIGAELIRELDSGYVRAKGYPGFRLRPIRTLPHAEGLALKEKLEALRVAHDLAERVFREGWKQQVIKLFGKDIGDDPIPF